MAGAAMARYLCAAAMGLAAAGCGPFVPTGGLSPSPFVLTLSARSVVGGNSVTGTVNVSAAASAAGTVVTLSSSDPVSVPENVTIRSGETTAAFTVNTRAVGGTFNNVPITATAGGQSSTATLTVTVN